MKEIEIHGIYKKMFEKKGQCHDYIGSGHLATYCFGIHLAAT